MHIIFRIKIQKRNWHDKYLFIFFLRNLSFQIDGVPNLCMWLMFEWLLTKKIYVTGRVRQSSEGKTKVSTILPR